ncbi:MAG: hypothetical protein OEY49_14375 [Candidatus Heimdallarchaeota archaeon]|nr:hypothetical protein [Candidatus Heimdallarchaeota archaeon]
MKNQGVCFLFLILALSTESIFLNQSTAKGGNGSNIKGYKDIRATILNSTPPDQPWRDWKLIFLRGFHNIYFGCSIISF